MQRFSIRPSEALKSFWRNRALIYALTKREVLGRYRGSLFGIFWSLISPILMLVIYTFVFSVIFKSRWDGSASDSRVEFALVLFAGLIVFNLFSECISRAPALIISNINYVKKVIFPLEILPWVVMGGALFNFFISLFVWLCVYVIFNGMPQPTFLLMPLVLIPYILFVMGICWFLSSFGVFIRDTSQMIGMLITILMFVSPIFYPVTALPLEYQKFLLLNPLAIPIEIMRDFIYWGVNADLITIIWYWIFSTITAALGFVWFQKTRKAFADVI
jgi:lipopolysaccharide transport system permease protein